MKILNQGQASIVFAAPNVSPNEIKSGETLAVNNAVASKLLAMYPDRIVRADISPEADKQLSALEKENQKLQKRIEELEKAIDED